MTLHIQIKHRNLERREILRLINNDMVKAVPAFISAEQIMNIEQRRQILFAQDAFLSSLTVSFSTPCGIISGASGGQCSGTFAARKICL